MELAHLILERGKAVSIFWIILMQDKDNMSTWPGESQHFTLDHHFDSPIECKHCQKRSYFLDNYSINIVRKMSTLSGKCPHCQGNVHIVREMSTLSGKWIRKVNLGFVAVTTAA